MTDSGMTYDYDIGGLDARYQLVLMLQSFLV